jgi:alkaline phosphatase
MRFSHLLRSACIVFCAAPGLTAFSALADEAKLMQADNPYFKSSLEQLNKVLAQKPNTNRAKNVILFIGDGYGVSTMTAARIFEGQSRGVDGPSNKLAHENFPYAALSRTYAHDALVTDSAPSAVAMTAGVKSNNNMLGLSGDAVWKDCEKSKGKEVTTIGEMAKTLGLSVGAVSTARITDATPAAVYAHAAHRSWESDADLGDAAKAGCIDIARQLVEFKFGDGLDVMFGGGRMNFLPETTADPEYADKKGKRKDGRDLTAEWLKRYSNSGAYAWNLETFNKIDPANTAHALALFERADMQYEADRKKDTGGEPSLSEMAMKAIDILAKNPQGYFLMVEGGRIDHGSHANNAYRTLTDAVAMNDALKAVLAKVSLDDTLVIVTADHSHTLTISGYPDRDANILGLVKEKGKVALDLNGKPYTIIGYVNGPGAKDGPRADLKDANTLDVDYVQQSLAPLASETHAGEDVAIFAAGPWAHLVQGIVDENYIFFVMDYALKAGERLAAKR